MYLPQTPQELQENDQYKRIQTLLIECIGIGIDTWSNIPIPSTLNASKRFAAPPTEFYFYCHPRPKTVTRHVAETD